MKIKISQIKSLIRESLNIKQEAPKVIKYDFEKAYADITDAMVKSGWEIDGTPRKSKYGYEIDFFAKNKLSTVKSVKSLLQALNYSFYIDKDVDGISLIDDPSQKWKLYFDSPSKRMFEGPKTASLIVFK
jgi:hypothetical protein